MFEFSGYQKKIGWGLIWCIAILLTACNFRFVPTATPSPTTTPSLPPRLTVAYLQNHTLFLWREGDSVPQNIAANANPPLALAPDGRHIAFTRGQEGQPQTLWVVNTDGTLQQELVELGDIPAQRSARAMISDMRWLDETALYFNTYQAYQWGDQPDNNLYRVDIGTEAQAGSSQPRLILPPGAGGEFAFSPNRQHIAAVYPGQYDTERGRIHILDPFGEQVRTALEFPAVTTSSEVPLYPPLEWTGDSSAVRVPISSRALMNDEVSAPPVQLWHLPVEGESRIMGYVPAAFNGLPRWSARTNIMLYHQRRQDVAGMYDLYLAEPDGANPQPYADGSLEILDAKWTGEQFVYLRGTTLMRGARGQAPKTIVESVSRWILAGDYAIYTTHSSGVTDLRYTRVDTSFQSVLIASVVEPVIFDAVFAP